MNPIAAPQPDIRPAATAAAPGFSSIDLPDLVAVVEAQLQQAIVEGRLPPGARIVEAELARQMGVSRAPVREAARRLESQGLLVARPRYGFTVRTLDLQQINDLFQVRIGLEVMATGLACRRPATSNWRNCRPASTTWWPRPRTWARPSAWLWTWASTPAFARSRATPTCTGCSATCRPRSA